MTAIAAEEQARIIAVAKARGNEPRDFRDAVHEMAHVIDTGIEDYPTWDRNTDIHEAIAELEPSDQFRLECRARAAEQVACEMAGVDYDPSKWLMLAAMEAVKGGLSAPLDAWKMTIEMFVRKGQGKRLVTEVRKLAERLGKPSQAEELRAIVREAEARLRKGAAMTPEGRQKLRQAKAWLLGHDHGDGAVAARKCRATGALRVLYRPGTQSEDEGWFVTCQDHATCLSTDTRKTGESAMADPDWCEECQVQFTLESTSNSGK